MMTPFAFLSKMFATRNAWSWLCEVLPVWLLALQSIVAFSAKGDVDGHSDSPLFGPAIRRGDIWMSNANAKIQTLLGRWNIQERHNIDEFMEGMHAAAALYPATTFKRERAPELPSPAAVLGADRSFPAFLAAALGFASWQRALIARAGQSTTLEHAVDSQQGDTLRIVTQDLRGTSQLELPLSGGDVAANDGDGGARVCRAATIEGSGAKPSLIVTERFPNEREPYSTCRRTLQPDGRMCIDVTKRTSKGNKVAMRAIAQRQS